MTLSNEINNLPSVVGEGSAGHLGNHRVIHEALKVHDADIQTAITTADTASTTAQNAETRVTSVEAMAGLSPESPVDGQTANLISQPDTLTRAALSDTYADKAVVEQVAPQKMVFGLPVPKPHRAPNLAILRTMPDNDLDLQVIGTEGGVLWARGADSSLYKSDSSGKNWEHRSYHPSDISARGGITRCADGSLLIFDSSYRIRRSTDDGRTWDVVHERRGTGLEPLTTQSMVVQPETGHIYYGEYTNGTGEDVVDCALWRSTDHGVTWEIFYTWGLLGRVEGPEIIRHIHSVQIDPYTDEVYVMLGDGTPATGIWKVQGDTCVPVLTNEMLSPDWLDSPRCIGMMFFPDWIAWGSDSTNQPHIFRIPRSAFGTDPSKLERGPRLSSTTWGTARASEDGSRWVMFSSDESFPAHAADRMAHIYAVEDQGATVYEVGSVPSRAGSGVTTLQPLAQPEEYGLDFWFNMRTGGSVWRGAWQARLGYGGQTIPWPPTSETSFTQSQNSGMMELDASGSEVFGVTAAPTFAKTLAIWEGSAYRSAGGSAGSVRMQVVVDGEEVWQTPSISARQASRREHGGPVARVPVTAGKTVEFRIRNTHGTPATGCAGITYAWSRP